jgi:drug/metabolite transporter (DMT)-like permease
MRPIEPPPSKNERDLLFVVKLSSALGMGALAAFLYSLKDVHPSIRFEFTAGTAIIALGVAVASWFFCGLMARADAEEHPSVTRRKFFIRWLLFFGGFCAIGTVFAFANSLRNVSTRGRRDVIEGTVLAFLVLFLGGWLIRKAFRFFEEQDKATLDEQHREEDESDE